MVELHGNMLGVVRVCRGLMMMSPVRCSLCAIEFRFLDVDKRHVDCRVPCPLSHANSHALTQLFRFVRAVAILGHGRAATPTVKQNTYVDITNVVEFARTPVPSGLRTAVCVTGRLDSGGCLMSVPGLGLHIMNIC